MHRRYTVFMLLRATPAWLALGRGERLAFHDETLQLVFDGFPAVTLRYYDTEAFHGRCSGVAVWETRGLHEYYALVEALRGTAFFSRYFGPIPTTAIVAHVRPLLTSR